MDIKMQNIKNEILKIIRQNGDFNGILETKIPNLVFYMHDEKTEFSTNIYEPSLCIIMQGEKSVGFGNEIYKYDENGFLLSCANVLADIKLSRASKQMPFISLVIKFDLDDIQDVIDEISDFNYDLNDTFEKGLFFGNMNIELYEAIFRFLQLLDKKDKHIEYISKLVMKEILYILVLNSDSGAFLSKFAINGTMSNKISKAISEIRTNFAEKINIKTLSRAIDMSESSFYKSFKAVTSFSPIQYQKKIRLEEARRILAKQKIKITDVAMKVGYDSQSQFNREYFRMFGVTPKAHAVAFLQR